MLGHSLYITSPTQSILRFPSVWNLLLKRSWPWKPWWEGKDDTVSFFGCHLQGFRVDVGWNCLGITSQDWSYTCFSWYVWCLMEICGGLWVNLISQPTLPPIIMVQQKNGCISNSILPTLSHIPQTFHWTKHLPGAYYNPKGMVNWHRT